MEFWRSPRGATCLVIAGLFALILGGVLMQVHLAMSPPRDHGEGLDFDSMRVKVESVRFPAADGLMLEGWLIEGRDSQAPVILCHDRGSSKAALVNLAIRLREEGFPVLLFDFRGHGSSDDARSTLGLREKRDVLGAIDYMTGRMAPGEKSVAIYGVGMGAHAAVLAAQDRPRVRALVLDGLYPDASYPLVRDVFEDWSFGVRNLSAISDGLFVALSGTRIGRERAEDSIENLVGRDLLLLAPRDDADLSEAMKRMYRRIPEQVDVDGNLVLLPSTLGDGLQSRDLLLYHRTVSDFLLHRLSAS